jgi:ribonuclease D
LQRPLTNSQLRYARDDVLYLSGVYEKLVEKANKKQRLHWIEEELAHQLGAGLFEQDPGDLWRKVKKSKSLKERDLPVLRELAIWRDTVARKVNKPLRFILSDEAMIELARIDSLTLENLQSRRGVTQGIVNRYGREILSRHTKGREKPRDEWPRNQPNRRPPSDKSEFLADLAWLLIKEIADKAHLAPVHLITKKDLPYFIEAYVRGHDLAGFPISHGWRKATVGDLLVKLIDGQLTIKVQNRNIVWLDETE